MWVASSSRVVYVLGDDGMESKVVWGGGIDVAEGTLVRDGRRYLYVGRAGVVEVDTARARQLYHEIVSNPGRKLAPLGKPRVRVVDTTQEEQELVAKIVARRGRDWKPGQEWEEPGWRERLCTEAQAIDTNVDGAFVLKLYR